jgi:DNA-binding Lrp family transcriptional regulator
MPATKMDSVKQAGILRVNELQKSGQTTVAALVAILGKSPSTVRKAIRNLYPGVTASGRTTYLSTEQAAVVLAGMRRLHGRKRAK